MPSIVLQTIKGFTAKTATPTALANWGDNSDSSEFVTTVVIFSLSGATAAIVAAAVCALAPNRLNIAFYDARLSTNVVKLYVECTLTVQCIVFSHTMRGQRHHREHPMKRFAPLLRLQTSDLIGDCPASRVLRNVSPVSWEGMCLPEMLGAEIFFLDHLHRTSPDQFCDRHRNGLAK